MLTTCAIAPVFASGGGAAISQPVDGSMVSGSVAIAVSMAPRVSAASVYIDGSLYASAAQNNLTWDSSAVSDGSHVISVKSFSQQGRFLGGQTVMVEVQNGNSTPAPTTTATETATPTPVNT
ncbi:MAG TPA: Ig-like domain-containing protein, partial [Candidatus Binataceae bacterium]|nr:Ig-like domain-containing protein [Candidatus Binataceae bacterium]